MMNTTHSFNSSGPIHLASERHVLEEWNTRLHSLVNLKTLKYKFPFISVHLPNNSSISCLFSSRFLPHCHTFPKSKPPNNCEKMQSAFMFFALECSGSFYQWKPLPIWFIVVRSGLSLVQRSPADCGMSHCDSEFSIMKRPCPKFDTSVGPVVYDTSFELKKWQPLIKFPFVCLNNLKFMKNWKIFI